jgi:hypothetical protein
MDQHKNIYIYIKKTTTRKEEKAVCRVGSTWFIKQCTSYLSPSFHFSFTCIREEEEEEE